MLRKDFLSKNSGKRIRQKLKIDLSDYFGLKIKLCGIGGHNFAN